MNQITMERSPWTPHSRRDPGRQPEVQGSPRFAADVLKWKIPYRWSFVVGKSYL